MKEEGVLEKNFYELTVTPPLPVPLVLPGEGKGRRVRNERMKLISGKRRWGEKVLFEFLLVSYYLALF